MVGQKKIEKNKTLKTYNSALAPSKLYLIPFLPISPESMSSACQKNMKQQMKSCISFPMTHNMLTLSKIIEHLTAPAQVLMKATENIVGNGENAGFLQALKHLIALPLSHHGCNNVDRY